MPVVAGEQSSTSAAENQSEHTYGQILKSSAIIGGSTVLKVGIGIVRTKIMALLLGPAGFGLAGLYMSIITLTQSIAGMGINGSGVRQIAEAAGSGATSMGPAPDDLTDWGELPAALTRCGAPAGETSGRGDALTSGVSSMSFSTGASAASSR